MPNFKVILKKKLHFLHVHCTANTVRDRNLKPHTFLSYTVVVCSKIGFPLHNTSDFAQKNQSFSCFWIKFCFFLFKISVFFNFDVIKIDFNSFTIAVHWYEGVLWFEKKKLVHNFILFVVDFFEDKMLCKTCDTLIAFWPKPEGLWNWKPIFEHTTIIGLKNAWGVQFLSLTVFAVEWPGKNITFFWKLPWSFASVNSS